MTRKLLYIAPHRPGRSPGQRFRFEQFLNYLNANGVEVTYSFLLNAWDDHHFYHHGNYLSKVWIAVKGLIIRLFDVLRASRFDYVLVYREAHFFGTSIFERMLSRKAVMLFDFDDAIWLNDISESNRNLGWLKNSDKTAQIVKMADLVTVGNSFLAEYAHYWNENVAVIPTTIDTDLYSYRGARETDTVVIGWIGSLTTLKHFQESVPALARVKEKYGDRISFKVIVDVDYRESRLNLVSTKWSKETEVDELLGIDIGIMPLPNNDWSKGKCGFKGIQYMSVGIATIMTPVGVNVDIISNGQNGLLATTEQEWVDCLSRLIDSPELRRQMGEAGRATVEQRFSVKSQQQHFVDSFRRASELKKRKQ